MRGISTMLFSEYFHNMSVAFGVHQEIMHVIYLSLHFTESSLDFVGCFSKISYYVLWTIHRIIYIGISKYAVAAFGTALINDSN